MGNIAEIVANPEAHGFTWGNGEVHRGTGPNAVLLRKNAPHIVHVNIDLVRETFGDDYFLNSANGTSARVRDQRVTRTALNADATVSNDDLKEKVIAAALGQRTRSVSTRTVFAGPNGTTFDTQDDAEAAWEEYIASK